MVHPDIPERSGKIPNIQKFDPGFFGNYELQFSPSVFINNINRKSYEPINQNSEIINNVNCKCIEKCKQWVRFQSSKLPCHVISGLLPFISEICRCFESLSIAYIFNAFAITSPCNCWNNSCILPTKVHLQMTLFSCINNVNLFEPVITYLYLIIQDVTNLRSIIEIWQKIRDTNQLKWG